MAEGCGWNDARLASIKGTITLASFTAEGYVGLGVPLGTNTFVQKFVHDACQKVIDDIDKLDHIEDGFVHYQLLRFCQATRLQYLNSHVSLDNQQVMQQQHVDYKIAEALLKKGTNDAHQTWAPHHRALVDMANHLPHDHGGFGITSNVISRKATLYTATARFIAFVGTLPLANQSTWLPDNLGDPSTWTLPPLHHAFTRLYAVCSE